MIEAQFNMFDAAVLIVMLLSTMLAASSQRLIVRLFYRDAFARMRTIYSRSQ